MSATGTRARMGDNAGWKVGPPTGCSALTPSSANAWIRCSPLRAFRFQEREAQDLEETLRAEHLHVQ